MKPKLIVIGAMKAGTTSLHHYLDAHPDIEMTTPKEVHYFSRNYQKGDEWYLNRFDGMQAKIIGETSPSYTRLQASSPVPQRMHQLLPKTKLIYVLRDPIERIVSHYRHSLLGGSENKDINTGLPSNLKTYTRPSKYFFQLSQYLQFYDLSDIKILSSHDLRNNTTKTVQDVYGFLEVDDSFEADIFENKMYQTDNRKEKSALDKFILNTLGGRAWLKPLLPQWAIASYQQAFKDEKDTTKHELSTDNRNMLKGELSEDVSKLRELTGRKFSSWSV